MSNRTDIDPTTTLPPYIDRSQEQLWLSKHSKEFAGQWVAMDGSRLLSHGPNAREVYQAAKNSGVNRPMVVQVETEPELPFGGW